LTQFANILVNTNGRVAERLMGTPINTPLTSEIWHLTIDDLLEPLPASPRLGGPGPFVINLSASTAPISVPMKTVADHPGTYVYQIQRTEDRRVRYRLRLGPFETEAEAEALLTTVREIYPSALTASAEAEDLRSIESIKTKIEAQQLAAVKAAVSKAAAAPLANARPGPARVAPPEPPQRPLAASADGEALPTTPPPAWLALRTSSAAPVEQTTELDFSAPPVQPAPKPPASVKVAAPALPKSVAGFAPARWSASARAFVPRADLASAPAPATPAAEKTQAGAAAPAASLRPAVAVSTSSATPAALMAPVHAESATRAEAPARTDVPVAAVRESLIPVLSESVVLPRPTPTARVAASPPPALKVSGPAPAAPATGTSASSVAILSPVTAPSVAATAPAVVTPPPAAVAAPPVIPTPPVMTAPPTIPPPVVATVRPVTPLVSSAAASAAAPARKAPGGAVSFPTPIPAPAQPMTSAVRAAAPQRTLPGSRVERFDTTQTLRPLTPKELEDASALRWFVIQLSCAEEAFDPEALPNLDIFSEYRLYSVASLDQGKLVHALRVGFFSEESHAKAVAGYLATFYDDPTVKRVSTAERTRFAQHRVEARKDIGATGNHAVIEITDERVIRPKRSSNTTVLPGRPPLPTPSSDRGR
jgi:hypothetical protein